ncbi:MAG: hypothetical protein AUJ39_01145 [Parcubacteria group bacterium CG1_02_42_13]|nr:MAG: hypothetical protein AUJ39_01145 [Parcubacteria group bacterium CG1_02_42_13]
MEKTKDLRVEIKFRNNRLYKAIFNRYKSVSEFCKEIAVHVHPATVYRFLNLESSPLKRSGEEYKNSCKNIATFFGLPVEDLFPIHLYQIKKTQFSGEIAFSRLRPLIYASLLSLPAPDPYEELEKKEQPAELKRVLTKALSSKELLVLYMRWGLNDEEPLTLKEVGKEFGVTCERIRQIEAKALKKLRHITNKRQIERIYFP